VPTIFSFSFRYHAISIPANEQAIPNLPGLGELTLPI
jgi:hypothetical protein